VPKEYSLYSSVGKYSLYTAGSQWRGVRVCTDALSDCCCVAITVSILPSTEESTVLRIRQRCLLHNMFKVAMCALHVALQRLVVELCARDREKRTLDLCNKAGLSPMCVTRPGFHFCNKAGLSPMCHKGLRYQKETSIRNAAISSAVSAVCAAGTLTRRALRWMIPTNEGTRRRCRSKCCPSPRRPRAELRSRCNMLQRGRMHVRPARRRPIPRRAT
jgi:hypothetical protein